MMKLLKYIPTIILSLLLPIMLQGCDRYDGNPVLNRLDKALNRPEITSDEAAAIHSRIVRINSDSLTEAEKHYRDFLTIKSADKAYIPHTSDSLFLTVRDFFEKQDDDTFTETLYYGGRVYSEMGVYPLALEYYQGALDRLERNKSASGKLLRIRGAAVSQAGRLYNDLRIYSSAVGLIEQAIKVDSILMDSLNLMYDHQLLGIIQFHKNLYNDAEKNFNTSNRVALKVQPDAIFTNEAYLAVIDKKKGNLESAVRRIEEAVEKSNQFVKPTVYAFAAEIYMERGDYKKASEICKANLSIPDSYNKENAYHWLLSDSLRKYIPDDSLIIYFNNYKSLLDGYYDYNQNEATLMQHTKYNYQLHDRDRLLAERKLNNYQLMLWAWIGGSVLCIIIIFVYIKYWRQKTRNKYIMAVDRIRILEERINSSLMINESELPSKISGRPKSGESISHLFSNPDKKEIDGRIRKLLNSIIIDTGVQEPLSSVLTASNTYEKLNTFLSQEKVLSENDIFWDELAKAINDSYPDTLDTWIYLIGGPIKQMDLNILMLLKCRIQLTAIAKLIGRTKGALTQRRKKLIKLMFDQDFDLSLFDNLIALL